MFHRFYVPQWSEGAEITGEEFHHARVLRLRDGEDVELFDGRGRAVTAKVESVRSDAVTVRVIGPADNRERSTPMHLAMAVIQLDKFELVLQKATELGAASIIPMTTSRVEVRPERYRGKRERWEKIVFEAVKQCGRSVIPKIEETADFSEVINREGLRILYDITGTTPATQQPRNPATLIIGPEGGWTDEEIAEARAAGCTIHRLGSRRLRAETAAITALAVTGTFIE